MISREELSEQFEVLGSVPPPEVLDKCVEICITHGLDDAEEFVEQWMAFSVSNLGGADPTIEHLRHMERKEFLGKKENIVPLKKSDRQSSLIYNSSVIENCPDENILESYTCTSPKSNNRNKQALTPEQSQRKSSHGNGGRPNSPTCTPFVSTPSEKSDSSISGSVVCTFGKPDILKQTTWKCTTQYKVNIKQIPNRDGEILTSTAKYMYDNMGDKCAAIAENMYSVGTELCNRYLNDDLTKSVDHIQIKSNGNDSMNSTMDTSDMSDIDMTDYNNLSNVDIGGQKLKNCIGRMYCDADGHLNAASVMMHGTDEQALRRTRLHFNRMPSYNIFPGQVCLVKGVNPRGTTMYPQDIKADISLPPSPLPELSSADGSLNIVVISGPFTQSDNINYQPFKEIISYLKQNTPHVVILIGPFIDIDHPGVQEGLIPENFQDFFEKMVSGVMEAVSTSLTEVLIVASSRDAVGATVYPTLPYSLYKSNYTNLHLLPDPCTVNINGVIISITATDVIKHINEEELAINVGRDKIKRSVRHILYQQNMYPLQPPSFEVSLDSTLWEKFCNLTVYPHILVAPSDQRYYVRDVDSCLAINPGRVCEGVKTGTIGRLEINPCIKGSFLDNLACQIIKI